MKRVLLAIALILLACAACAGDSPDFAWGNALHASVRTPLKQAESKWNEAAKVPTSPQCLKSSKSKRFDEVYLREVLGREGFAYDLLDVAMTKLKCIDECRDLYAKAISAAGPRAPKTAKSFDDSYYLLKSSIRLAIGLARAGIAREMAGENDTSSYCFQAMESAIDALRDAAADAEKGPDGAARAGHIRAFRTSLFEVWESAQRSKDTRIIGAIDLVELWDRSRLTKQADKK